MQRAVIFQFRVVNEVNGIIHRHTEHHRQKRGGHHVERYACPTHIAAYEDCWHHVWNQSDKSYTDALERYHKYHSNY